MATFKIVPPGDSVVAERQFDDDSQNGLTNTSNLSYVVEAFDWLNGKFGRLAGRSQDEIDLALLRLAGDGGPSAQDLSSLKAIDAVKHAIPGGMPRFKEVFSHFLSGSKNALQFATSELLRTCPRARRAVTEKIAMRLARHSDVILGHPACDMDNYLDMSRHKPRSYAAYWFDIAQAEYDDTDWQFALGTFRLMWEPLLPAGPAVGPLCTSRLGDDWIDEGTLALTRHRPPAPWGQSSSARPIRARVWGAKVWRWHSQTGRASLEVHQAAYRLVQKGKLHNFWVIGEPCVINIASGFPL